MFFFLKFLFLVIPILLSVAFLTLIERKFLSLVSVRLGPNKVSFTGVLQPITDAFKLFCKESNYISNFSIIFYYFSPSVLLGLGLFFFSCLFSSSSFPVNFKFSLFLIFIFLSLMNMNLVVCGWSTFSKFSLIGSIRSISQLISYEGSLFVCFFFFCYIYMSFDFIGFYNFTFNFFLLFFPFCFYVWIPTILCELNRTPYDFSEGESELVSGFNTEFGSCSFTLIFLTEYMNIISFSILSSFLFIFSSFSFILFLIFILWIRSVLPRYRFDKLMMLCWKFFIPFLTSFFLFFLAFSF